MFAIRLYQQYGSFVLPQGARWDALPPLAKVVLPFALTLLGGALFAMASGTAVLPALLASMPAALGSIGLHHATKIAGTKMDEAALKRDPYHETPEWRKAMSIALPMAKQLPLHDLKP